MSIHIHVTNSEMPTGEITDFDVTARCPSCDNETSVTESELRSQEAQCQHCDDIFRVYLGN